jgi:hypothetical protein
MDTWITGSDDAYFNDGPSSETHDDDGNPAAPWCVPCARCTRNTSPMFRECPECGHRNTPGEKRHDEGTVAS